MAAALATCLEINGGNEQSSHAGVKLPPRNIAYVPLMMKNITHGGIVVVSGALGVQVQTVLKMGIPVHGTEPRWFALTPTLITLTFVPT